MIYPKLFRSVGEASRRRNTHYATDWELDELRTFFRTNSCVFLAERNVLIADIIETVGFRQGTVNSLTIDLFGDDNIENALHVGETELTITPRIQKRGYTDSYDFPINLAIRINNFIRSERREMLDYYGCDERTASTASNMIFIADKTCKPLVNDGISEIVSRGFKSIGSPKGSGPHSIRRKFGKSKATEILQIRAREGRSIDPVDTVLDLMPALGHSNMASQEAYTAGKLDMYKMSRERELQNMLEEERAKRAAVEIELAKVKRVLKHSG